MSRRTRPHQRAEGNVLRAAPPRSAARPAQSAALSPLVSPTSRLAERLGPQARFLLFRLLPFLVMAGALLALLASSGSAQEAIRVQTAAVDNRWPRELAFQITASSEAATITEITVLLQVGSGSSSQRGRVAFEPGRTVQGEYVMRTRGTSYVPPGTDIEYAFEIVDAAGNRLTTPTARMMYLDPRFTWDFLKSSSAPATAWYYGNGAGMARTSLKAVEDATRKLERAGLTIARPFKLILYNTREHWRDAQNTRSETQERELILLGTAHADHDLVLVLADPAFGDVAGTAAHEFTHLLVNSAAGNLVPAWLNEGLAVYGQPSVEGSYLSFLETAIRQNRLPPLRGLASLPGRPADNIAGYGQAYSVVTYLIDTHGPDKMRSLLQAIKEGQAIDAALQQVYGLEQDSLDARWRESVGAPPRQYDFSAPTPIAVPSVPPMTMPQSPGSPAQSEPGVGEAAGVAASNPAGAFMLVGVGLIVVSLLAAAGLTAAHLFRRRT
ncbi:MAG: hypothetical protein HY689_05880 [Chloroflexi bacterium]|nr:hypothetical protein [Chloroflexota bacterium]